MVGYEWVERYDTAETVDLVFFIEDVLAGRVLDRGPMRYGHDAEPLSRAHVATAWRAKDGSGWHFKTHPTRKRSAAQNAGAIRYGWCETRRDVERNLAKWVTRRFKRKTLWA